MRNITEVIIHCTATDTNWRAGDRTSSKVAEVKKWHTDKGWSDIGYHYLIDQDGTLAKGRPVTKTGAHVRGHNAGTIGVSLFGGRTSAETDDFLDNFTPQQEAALKAFIADMRATYGANIKISGHNQYAAKACPGFNVPKWVATMGDAPAVPAEAIPSGIDIDSLGAAFVVLETIAAFVPGLRPLLALRAALDAVNGK